MNDATLPTGATYIDAAAALKRMCAALGLRSLAALSRATGVPYGTLHNIKTSGSPTASLVEAIVAAGLSLDEILIGRPPVGTVSVGTENVIDTRRAGGDA